MRGGEGVALAQMLPDAVKVSGSVGESVGEREAEPLRVAAVGEGGGEGVTVAQKLAVSEKLREGESRGVGVGEWELLFFALAELEGCDEREATVLMVEASDCVGESVGERDEEQLRVPAEGDFWGDGVAVAQPLVVSDDAREDEEKIVGEGAGEPLGCVLAEREGC